MAIWAMSERSAHRWGGREASEIIVTEIGYLVDQIQWANRFVQRYEENFNRHRYQLAA